MTTRDIHIRIEQGLNNIGSFAYADMEHDEIDIAYNSVVYMEIRNVFRDVDGKINSNNFERNQYYTDYFQILKEQYSNNGVDNGDNHSITLPNDYIHRVNDYSVVIAKNCKGQILESSDDEIEKDFYYKVIKDVKYDGQWYKNCEIFKGGEIKNFYGTVEKIPVKKVRNRFVRSEVIDWKLNSQISKSVITSPVSELIGNTLIIHKNKFDVAEIGLTYIRKPVQINYNLLPNQQNEFNDSIVTHFIEKTIQHISINTEQNQSKIYNKKAENLENS